jgi:excinuclease UvrABC helicase subunit UvrB
MESNSYQNLITLLKLFKNRPYHLAKYLLENSAFTDKFIENISNSSKLSDLSDEPENIQSTSLSFISISQMEDFYASLLDSKELDTKKSHKELEKEINKKLDELIQQEKFEEAAYLRDWMKMKKMKRNSK